MTIKAPSIYVCLGLWEDSLENSDVTPKSMDTIFKYVYEFHCNFVPCVAIIIPLQNLHVRNGVDQVQLAVTIKAGASRRLGCY